MSAELAERLARQLDPSSPLSLDGMLSPRELEVLRLVAMGQSVKRIAAALSLSDKTIAAYRARIAEKLGVSSNVERARYALKHGLVE